MGILKSNKGLEVLYTDTFSIYRPTIVKDQWGGAINKDVIISKNNPCRLSKAGATGVSSSTEIKNGINGSEQFFKLFIPIDKLKNRINHLITTIVILVFCKT